MSRRVEILFVITIALLLFMNFQTCKSKHDMKEGYENAIEFVEKENNQLIQEKNLEVYAKEQMRQNLVSERQANSLLKEELKSFKSIQAYIKAEMKTQMKDVLAQYVDGLDTTITVVTKNDETYMKVPRPFIYSDKWTELTGTVTTGGVLIDSLMFINKFDITVGWKRDRWYSKQKPVMEMKSYNPNTSIPYMNNVVIKKPTTPWYTSRAAMFGYGVLAGFIISR